MDRLSSSVEHLRSRSGSFGLLGEVDSETFGSEGFGGERGS